MDIRTLKSKARNDQILAEVSVKCRICEDKIGAGDWIYRFKGKRICNKCMSYETRNGYEPDIDTY